jgi:hypothetical protein
VEADWEVELGGGAPVIDACWPGFVDLQRTPEQARELAETLALPALAPALIRLNSVESQFFTVKCDVWPITEMDPLEFDAPLESAVHGLAIYIDLLPHDAQRWPDIEKATAWCKRFCAFLKAKPLRCCRADLIIRHAIRAPNLDAIGITAYLASCGPTAEVASAQLEAVLAVFADSVAAASSRGPAYSKLQLKSVGE